MSFGFTRRQSPASRSANARHHRLRNLRIDEISSVDKGAGLGVEVVLLKNQRREAISVIAKAMTMPERDLIPFAKTDGIDKPTLSQLIADKAEALRKDGETREQAFVRYITANSEGSALYQIMKAAPGPDHHQATAIAMLKAAQRPGEEHPPAESSPGEDDEGDDPGIDGRNGYHMALEMMARRAS